MLTLVMILALCRQCVGNSESFSNLENSQQKIRRSIRKSEEIVNENLHQKNVEESGQSLEKLMEVLEVKYF